MAESSTPVAASGAGGASAASFTSTVALFSPFSAAVSAAASASAALAAASAVLASIFATSDGVIAAAMTNEIANAMRPTHIAGRRSPSLAARTMSSVPRSSALLLAPLSTKKMTFTATVNPTMRGNAYLARSKLVAGFLSTM